jgi:transposase-like protein
MRPEVDMTKRKRWQFTPEFKTDAVKLVRAGGRSIVRRQEIWIWRRQPSGGGFGRLRSKPERALQEL